MKTVLSIAGTDPVGGAGIQADIKTITMNGAYAMSAVTSLVAQNTLGVKDVLDVPADFLKKELDCVFEDIFPDSIKIGMVSSTPLIQVIANTLKHFNAENIVTDPVMVATSGSSLIKSDAVQTMAKCLFPLSKIITPNIPEAEALSEMDIKDEKDMILSAEKLEKIYGCAVLVKGGHNINDATDILALKGEIYRFEGKKINTSNTHGTGCTLSSAIAANLAKGLALPDAVGRAKGYVSKALRANLNLGKGSGPLMHNFILF